MFAPIFPPMIGGPATQSYNLCKALVARGYEVAVLTPGAKFVREALDGYPVYRYPWRYTGTFLDRGIRWLVFPVLFSYVLFRERPAVLHVHSVSGPSFIAGAIAKAIGVPSIIKFAGDWVWETLSTPGIKGKDFDELYRSTFMGRMLKSIERFGVSLFDIVWTPSDFRRENVRELLGSDEKTRKIPNSLLLPPGGAHDETERDPVVIISANRFIPHKRIDMIVRAFASLQHPNKRLVLIGGGEEKEQEKVRAVIQETGVSGLVEVTGILPSAEIYRRFSSASFYVSASLEEGFPNVFIEAMHFGLPIVATDVGGCKEMVIEGKTGFLVDSMDEAALAAALQRLAQDRPMRNRFAHAAYAESAQYDLATVVDRFISLYEELVSKRP